MTEANSTASISSKVSVTKPSEALGRRRRRRPGVGTILLHAFLIVAALGMVFPFVWQLIMSLSTNREIQSVPPTLWPEALRWDNYSMVFTKLPFTKQLSVSIAVTVMRTLGQLVLCSLAGYAFARLRFPGRNLLFGIVLVILMVPGQVYLIPQYQIIRDFGLLETSWGVALPGIFSAFGTFLMRQTFMGLPKELEESARIDGASIPGTFFRIMLPLATPGLAAVTITTVLWSWNDLLWPLVVTTKSDNMPLSVGIATLAGRSATDYSVMMAASTMAIAPILILFLMLQKRVIDGLAFSGLKG